MTKVRTATVFVVLAAVVQLCCAAAAATEVKLFDGHFVVRDNGIYTPIHYLHHAGSGTNVVLVASNHGGDAAYFEEIKKALAECDRVVHEDSPSTTGGQTTEEELKGIRSLATSEKLEAAWPSALQLCFMLGSRRLGLALETTAFAELYETDHWISGDAPYFDGPARDKEAQDAIMAELFAKMAAIPDEQKLKFRDTLNELSRRAENPKESFTARDFASIFTLVYQDKRVSECMVEILGKPRDRYMFEHVFDPTVEKWRGEKPLTIGIKYGGGTHQ